ncbi:hypothetical protein CHS0354_039936 [Potamilus streckersoni]|uniref:Uncharacterized protein n=1 Tax=Potamilus streckersoni TaxID=2493646 RepID=A0AAE0WE85_9BIVA|nr:hypothetical protein CHS0354_039936 [Potamilus streckersoni]
MKSVELNLKQKKLKLKRLSLEATRQRRRRLKLKRTPEDIAKNIRIWGKNYESLQVVEAVDRPSQTTIWIFSKHLLMLCGLVLLAATSVDRRNCDCPVMYTADGRVKVIVVVASDEGPVENSRFSKLLQFSAVRFID